MFIVRGTINWLKGVLRPFALMKENSISLIVFEVLFRILTFLVLFPIMTWMQRLWLIGNKTKVIAWYNAGSFIRNPISWLVFFVMILMLVSATLFEQFAIYDTLHASKWGKRRTVRQIFSTGFDMCAERAKLENWGLIPYVIFVMRFGSSAIADISSITSVIRIPGFILEDFNKRPWEGTAYRILVIVLTYFFVRWLFAIPIMMEEDGTSFEKACRKSAAMISGRCFIRVLALTVCWGLFCYVIFGIGTFLIVAAWYLLSMWVIPGETDLQTVDPELAAQWDMERNTGLMPENVTAFSNEKVWWICKKGHHWQASVAKRSMGKGCPYCGHKRADEKNNLAVCFPIPIIEEFRYGNLHITAN